MSAPYALTTTPPFDRLPRKLNQQHREFTHIYAEAIQILSTDPYNRLRAAQIKKLVDSDPDEGQFRLRLGR